MGSGCVNVHVCLSRVPQTGSELDAGGTGDPGVTGVMGGVDGIVFCEVSPEGLEGFPEFVAGRAGILGEVVSP